MERITSLITDLRWWRVASVLTALVLVACQNNPDGGGGGPAY